MDMSEIEKLERAKVGTIKLSDIVREHGYGSAVDPEDCVLGRSYQRLMGHKNSRRSLDNPRFKGRVVDYVSATAEMFNVPVEACRHAERMCISGFPHTDIADWLEAHGY